jgi:hypothetical protein
MIGFRSVLAFMVFLVATAMLVSGTPVSVPLHSSILPLSHPVPSLYLRFHQLVTQYQQIQRALGSFKKFNLLLPQLILHHICSGTRISMIQPDTLPNHPLQAVRCLQSPQGREALKNSGLAGRTDGTVCVGAKASEKEGWCERSWGLSSGRKCIHVCFMLCLSSGELEPVSLDRCGDCTCEREFGP